MTTQCLAVFYLHSVVFYSQCSEEHGREIFKTLGVVSYTTGNPRSREGFSQLLVSASELLKRKSVTPPGVYVYVSLLFFVTYVLQLQKEAPSCKRKKAAGGRTEEEEEEIVNAFPIFK